MARTINTSTVLSEIFNFSSKDVYGPLSSLWSEVPEDSHDGVLLEAWHSNREEQIRGKIYESFHSNGE